MALALLAAAEFGQAVNQALGVGVAGLAQHLGGVAFFDHAPGVHHQHPVGHFGHGAHVVGNEHNGRALVALQFAQQVKNLGLHCYVQRGGGLVGNQDVGAAGQRHGNHHALAHAARELVRVFVHPPLGRGNAHLAQHFNGLGAGSAAV